MIEVQSLTKQYKDLVAVNEISFEVPKGQILGFLGPNGAGKSTTMKMITGFLAPTRGQVRVDGQNVFDYPLEVKQKIGYLPENPPLYWDLTVKDYLEHVANLKGLPHRKIQSEISRAVSLCGLEIVYHRLIKNLSKGFKQRVGLGQSLLGQPPVLILDEPSSGLDPAQIREVRKLIQELAQHHTVILSTHILPEVRMICNNVIIIHKGTVVANDTIDNLSSQFQDATRLEARFLKAHSGVEQKVKALRGVTSVELNDFGKQLVVHMEKQDPELQSNILSTLSGQGVQIIDFHSVTPTLEDIFLQIVGGDESALRKLHPETASQENDAILVREELSEDTDGNDETDDSSSDNDSEENSSDEDNAQQIDSNVQEKRTKKKKKKK